MRELAQEKEVVKENMGVITKLKSRNFSGRGRHPDQDEWKVRYNPAALQANFL